jgi:uncharacterized RDD family membrane protein YckC
MAKRKYAGFFLRFVAWVLDSFILAIPTGVLVYLIPAIHPVLYIWLYYAYMESSAYQATLGKMLLGIKVTDLKGKRITFLRATGRYFGKILSGLILGIGFLMIVFTEKKQGLHDIIAKCLVVKA